VGRCPNSCHQSASRRTTARAKQEFRDAIRGGWASATRTIARAALEANLPLRVRYETDVLPTREDIVRRIPRLRDAYNTIDIAREAVDKTVSLVGGKDPRLSAVGLTQADEDKIQRQVSAMNLRLWISQTIRDAQVCGNGYAVTRELPDPGLHSLRDTTGRHAAAVAHRVLVSSQKPWLQARSARTAAGSPALASLGLEQLDAERLLALRHDTELCTLLQSTSEIGVGRLLDLAIEQPDLDQALRSRLRSTDEQELSDELYRTIVLDQAGAQTRLNFALSLVTFTAAKLTGEHRRAIFARCLTIVLRPVDPYDATAALTSGSARQAAAAMLAVDSSFDEDIIGALSDTKAQANVQALIASALKERPDEAAERGGSEGGPCGAYVSRRAVRAGRPQRHALTRAKERFRHATRRTSWGTT
jgi:hypothetical protein